jgi:hypothetical protein
MADHRCRDRPLLYRLYISFSYACYNILKLTNMYTFEQLKEDVRKEAEALRVHATKEEREKLDFATLNPSNIDRCIFGQMTGNCYSQRSASLIHACCVRYFKHNVIPALFDARSSMARIQDHVNGATVDNFLNERTGSNSESHFSAIEAYICLPEANNANLISYLRGETETLGL